MTSPTHRSDWTLLQKIAARDCTAAATLFDRHSDEIYKFLTRRVGAVDAEDLLQEVFVRALRRASTFRGDSTARTWLFAIGRYVLLERRRDRIHPTDELDLVELGPGPESMLIRNEYSRQLLCALERLPDEQAIVFELHRIDGLQHEEIAVLLGIGAAASRKRLQRASLSLSEMLRTGTSQVMPRHGHLESWANSLRLRNLSPESSQ